MNPLSDINWASSELSTRRIKSSDFIDRWLSFGQKFGLVTKHGNSLYSVATVRYLFGSVNYHRIISEVDSDRNWVGKYFYVRLSVIALQWKQPKKAQPQTAGPPSDFS